MERHHQPRQTPLYNKAIRAEQEKAVFPVNLSSDYLAVPNNLLLSLRRYWHNAFPKHSRIHVRGAPRTISTGKGLPLEFPLPAFPCPFASLANGKDMGGTMKFLIH